MLLGGAAFTAGGVNAVTGRVSGVVPLRSWRCHGSMAANVTNNVALLEPKKLCT